MKRTKRLLRFCGALLSAMILAACVQPAELPAASEQSAGVSSERRVLPRLEEVRTAWEAEWETRASEPPEAFTFSYYWPDPMKQKDWYCTDVSVARQLYYK